jgi:endonuclease/exonuclease/phosphatase family metal-dependent hydrolase
VALLHAADRRGALRVLVWNLFHGRSQPPAGVDLYAPFAALIAGWDWDVALLQEVPPWWPPWLARAASAEERTALTSRNLGLPLRRLLARRWPDLMRSNGGGANAVLSRTPIAAARAVRLRTRPERRVAQLVRLVDGTSIANYHASTRVPLAEAELDRLWGLARQWAGSGPLVLGGDLNLRRPGAPASARHVAARDVDHVFTIGLEPLGEPAHLARTASVGGREVELSDHIPLQLTLLGAG